MTRLNPDIPVTIWRRPVVWGPFTALQALFGGLLLCLFISLGGWLLSLTPGLPVAGILRASVGMWLSAHGAGFEWGQVTLSLTPLLFLGFFVVVAFGAARRAGRAMGIFTPEGSLREGSARDGLIVVATFTATYTLVFALLGPVTFTSQSAPNLSRAVTGALILSLLTSVTGVLDSGRGRGTPGWYTIVRQTLVWEYSIGLRAARVMLLGLLAGASLVLIAALAFTVPQQVQILNSLDAGVAGGIVLALGTLAFLPNLLTWALAAVAGPGFSFGTETSFGILGVKTQIMPSIPVLGALPGPDFGGGAWLLLALVPVAAGVWGGWNILRDARNAGSIWHVITAIAAAAVVAGAVVAGITALGNGGILAGSLSFVGANAWAVGGMVAAETFVGGMAILGLAATGLVSRLRNLLQGVLFNGTERLPRSARVMVASSYDIEGGLDRVIGEDGEIGSAAREREAELDSYYFDEAEEHELNVMETTALTVAGTEAALAAASAAASAAGGAEPDSASDSGSESDTDSDSESESESELEPDVDTGIDAGVDNAATEVQSAKYANSEVADGRSTSSIAAEVLGLTTNVMQQETTRRTVINPDVLATTTDSNHDRAHEPSPDSNVEPETEPSPDSNHDPAAEPNTATPNTATATTGDGDMPRSAPSGARD